MANLDVNSIVVSVSNVNLDNCNDFSVFSWIWETSLMMTQIILAITQLQIKKMKNKKYE